MSTTKVIIPIWKPRDIVEVEIDVRQFGFVNTDELWADPDACWYLEGAFIEVTRHLHGQGQLVPDWVKLLKDPGTLGPIKAAERLGAQRSGLNAPPSARWSAATGLRSPYRGAPRPRSTQ